jgi:hypothetical protein
LRGLINACVIFLKDEEFIFEIHVLLWVVLLSYLPILGFDIDILYCADVLRMRKSALLSSYSKPQSSSFHGAPGSFSAGCGLSSGAGGTNSSVAASDPGAVKVFAVLYTKSSNKKRKTYSDGLLKVVGSGSDTHMKMLTLFSEDNLEISKRNERMTNFPVVGDILMIGGYEIQIDSAQAENVLPNLLPVQPAWIHKSSSMPNKIPKLESKTVKSEQADQNEDEDVGESKPVVSVPFRPFRGPTFKHSEPIKSSSSAPPAVAPNLTETVRPSAPPQVPSIFDVDKALARQLKSHQVVGAAFISECLYGKNHLRNFVQTFSSSSDLDGISSDDGSDFVDDSFSRSSVDTGDDSLTTTTGVILADEVLLCNSGFINFDSFVLADGTWQNFDSNCCAVDISAKLSAERYHCMSVLLGGELEERIEQMAA